MIRRFIVFRAFDVRNAPLALQGLTLGVVVSVAAAAAAVFWRVAGLNDGRDRIAVAQVVAAGPASTNLAPILAWAPFGGTAARAPNGGEGLVLKAIFLASPIEASSALIAVGEAPALAVRPGHALPTGAVVQSIGIDHVVLLVGGQPERLTFPAPTGTAGPASGSAPVAPGAPAIPVLSAPAPQSAPVVGAAARPSVVEVYRQRLAGNAPSVARDLGVTATAQGYRVGDDLSAPLRAAGLQPGDLVAKVNNQPVGADANPRAILDQAILSGGARVEVVRNGRTLTLSFPLR